jgi:hypothetical protein
MKSVLEPRAFEEIKTRLHNFTESSPRQWGKMTPGQTMKHCQAPLEIMLGKNDYGLKPNWLVNVLFKKSMYNDKPWRKNLPTAKVMKQTEDRDFKTEKEKLISLLDELKAQPQKEWGKHPSFGYFTNEQWGQMQYKHLDHHLRQFGL